MYVRNMILDINARLANKLEDKIMHSTPTTFSTCSLSLSSLGIQVVLFTLDCWWCPQRNEHDDG